SAVLSQVQAKFSAEYAAAKKPEQKAALAKRLLDAAERDAADPPLQTAEWDEARRLAAEGNDFRLAVQALERRHAKYPLDLMAGMASICQTVQLPANKRADNAALAELATKWMERAVELDQPDAALTIGTAAQAAIRKLADRDRTRMITDRLAEVRVIQT